MAVKDMYIVHLKPDQTKSVPERIDEWGVGSQNGHQAVDITSHQPTRGRNSVFKPHPPTKQNSLGRFRDSFLGNTVREDSAFWS